MTTEGSDVKSSKEKRGDQRKENQVGESQMSKKGYSPFGGGAIVADSPDISKAKHNSKNRRNRSRELTYIDTQSMKPQRKRQPLRLYKTQ